jgi:hypothetical protein
MVGAKRAAALGLGAALVSMLVCAVPASASPAPARAQAAAVSIVSGAHGYKLASQTRNLDGTVAVTWKNAQGEVFYLGPPGARMSLLTTGNPSKHGSIILKAALSHQVSRAPRVLGRGQLARAVASDVARDRFPAGFRSAFSTEIPRISDGAIVDTTCIGTSGFGNDVTFSGCDTRTALQQQSGNNFIVDDMESHTESTGSLTPITQFKTSTYYTYPNDNTVNHTLPSATVSSGCSQKTYSISWKGVGISSSNNLCNGSLDPIGIGEPYGGGLWTGNVTGSRISIEPIIQDHSIVGTHVNPDSTFYIRVWVGTISLVVGCGNGKNC